MINLRHQTVNVNRLELIEALRVSLSKHTAEFEEAIKDYERAVQLYLEQALQRVKEGNYSDVVCKLYPPQNKEAEYIDVIDLLSVSVDDTIQLDSEAYKAYYKNEWSWTGQFKALTATYKSAIGG